MKHRTSSKIGDADAQLFREAIGKVRLLDPVPLPAQAPKPKPQACMLEADESAVLEELLDIPSVSYWEHTGDELSYLQEGYRPKVLRQLKRGQYSVQDELDLHQMNTTAAQASIRLFLAQAKRDGRTCVRIIHGKGLRSGPAGPVLKKLTHYVLRRRQDVVAFASAPPKQGGTGAVIVLLKSHK